MNRKRKLFTGCLLSLVGLFILILVVNTIIFFIVPKINEGKWIDSKPQDYSISVNYGSVLGVSVSYTETVTGEIIHRDDPYYSPNQSTIEDLFYRIRACIVNPFAVVLCSAEYDPIYGYPIHFWENDFDLGDIVEIKDFTPQ